MQECYWGERRPCCFDAGTVEESCRALRTFNFLSMKTRWCPKMHLKMGANTQLPQTKHLR